MFNIKKISYSIIIVLFFISTALLLVEGMLRLKNLSMKNYDIEMWKYSLKLKKLSDNPELGHEHLKSAKAILQSVEIRTNQFGLRGEAIPLETSNRRILFLGSSITLGWGVLEKETLTEQLKKMFQEKGETVEVLNGGIGNYNTPRYVELFFSNFKKLKPTDIVVQYFLRDAEVLDRGNNHWLLRNSQLGVTLWKIFSQHFGKDNKLSLEEHYKRVYNEHAQGFIEMKKNLKTLSDYCKENHINLYLAMTPDVHNLKNYPFTYIHDRIQQLSKEYDIQYIDLLGSLKNLLPEELWAMPGDPHPNALGHRLMAEAIFPLLVQR